MKKLLFALKVLIAIVAFGVGLALSNVVFPDKFKSIVAEPNDKAIKNLSRKTSMHKQGNCEWFVLGYAHYNNVVVACHCKHISENCQVGK